MMYKIVSSLLLSAAALLADPASDSSQEIRVYLSTASPLQPLYFAKLQCGDGSLASAYLGQLEQVLQFDFSHDGSSKLLPLNNQKEQLLSDKNTSAAFHPASWKNLGAAFVVKGTVSNKTLTVQTLSVHDGSLKQFSNIALSGSLAQDRKTLHKLADAIHKTFYNEDGAASSQILYSLKSKGGTSWVSEIWACDWDGGNARQLTREGSYCVTPVFVPESAKYANDRFLYVSYKMGQPKIFIASMREGVGKRLIDLRGNQLLPAISRQRDKIAFICDAGGRTDLFLQEFHPQQAGVGKPVQLFSHPRSTQASPTFSPDGKQIAFVSDKDGPTLIYVIPAHFSEKRANPVLITKINRENSCPSWSPDGKKLAYSAKTKGIRQIWIYDFDAAEERQLTDGPGNKENPSWAPDSKHLVFNSTDAGVSELYIVNLNQPEVVKITQGPGIKHYPTWGTR